ncbi:MAG: hypothetical protein ACK5AM_18260, partial [Pirellulaceae bacterium]
SRSDTMGTGIYWRLRQIKRLDAITYDSDYFGRTTGDFIEGNRLGENWRFSTEGLVSEKCRRRVLTDGTSMAAAPSIGNRCLYLLRYYL